MIKNGWIKTLDDGWFNLKFVTRFYVMGGYIFMTVGQQDEYQQDYPVWVHPNHPSEMGMKEDEHIDYTDFDQEANIELDRLMFFEMQGG